MIPESILNEIGKSTSTHINQISSNTFRITNNPMNIISKRHENVSKCKHYLVNNINKLDFYDNLLFSKLSLLYNAYYNYKNGKLYDSQSKVLNGYFGMFKDGINEFDDVNMLYDNMIKDIDISIGGILWYDKNIQSFYTYFPVVTDDFGKVRVDITNIQNQIEEVLDRV